MGAFLRTLIIARVRSFIERIEMLSDRLNSARIKQA
jgi:hypothetical protein